MSHSHDAPSDANFFTNFSWLDELIRGLLSISIWIATTVDTLGDIKSQTPVALSYYGIGAGIFTALLSAPGAAYCHRIMNINHQHSSDDDTGLPATQSHVPGIRPALTNYQKFALLGDGIAHIGESMGIYSIIALILMNLSNLTYADRIGINIGLLIWGLGASRAPVQTCYKNLLKYNRNKLAETVALNSSIQGKGEYGTAKVLSLKIEDNCKGLLNALA